jgi:hypothetical protein
MLDFLVQRVSKRSRARQSWRRSKRFARSSNLAPIRTAADSKTSFDCGLKRRRENHGKEGKEGKWDNPTLFGFVVVVRYIEWGRPPAGL